MSDTTTEVAATPTGTVVTTTKPPLKPAWKTTEGMLAFAAVLMSQLYTLGIVGDLGTSGKISAMICGALALTGHQVSRTMLKAGAS